MLQVQSIILFSSSSLVKCMIFSEVSRSSNIQHFGLLLTILFLLLLYVSALFYLLLQFTGKEKRLKLPEPALTDRWNQQYKAVAKLSFPTINAHMYNIFSHFCKESRSNHKKIKSKLTKQILERKEQLAL